MRWHWTLVIVLALSLAAQASQRGPIIILSDQDFTPENGVIAGTGTPQDPYIIAGWRIQVPEGAPYGIRIEGTRRPFILRGCIISGAMDPGGAAIYLADVRDGTVEDCIVQNSQNGIRITTSQGIALRGNFLSVFGIGLQVVGTVPEEYRHMIERTNQVNGKDVLYYYGLSGKVLDGLSAGHITLAHCRDVVLRGAKVEGGDGITVAFSFGVRIEGADLFRNRGHGLLILSSPNTELVDCKRIANNAQAGISVWLSEQVRITNCGLFYNQVGLYVNASDNLDAWDNTYAGNLIGVRITGATREPKIRQSLFSQNKNYGVELDSAIGPIVERCAFTDSDAAVVVDAATTYPIVRDCSMVNVGYGLSILGTQGTFERNLIARTIRGIIFEEAYQQAFPTGNTLRHNLIYRAYEGLYLGRETSNNRIYENLFWNCERVARDLGGNLWAPTGRGNWYSNYIGPDADGDGIGDIPVPIPGGGQDPAPLMERDFLPTIPGVVGTMVETTIVLVDGQGSQHGISVRVADQNHERFIGFQGLPPDIAQELAILFLWDVAGAYGFWNPNVFIALDVLFFAADGAYLGDLVMPPDTKDRYTSRFPFLAALELPQGKLAELGIFPLVRLVLPK